MERNTKTKYLAKSLHDFLRNSSTFSGSYIAKMPLPNMVVYDVAGYHFEAKFTDEYQCKLEITKNSKIEELVSVPYSKLFKEPDWTKFLEGIFILARKLT